MPKLKQPPVMAGETAEQATQALLESLADAAIIIGLDGTIFNINERFAERFARQPRECIGCNVHHLIIDVLGIPPLSGYLKEKCEAAFHIGKSLVFEDITDIWKVSINPVRSSNAEIDRFFIIIQDIAEQKQLDRTQRKEQVLKSILIDAIPCSAIILDSNLKLMTSNRMADELLFDSDEEGRPIVDPDDFFYPDDIEPLRKKFLDTIETGKESYDEMQVYPRGGDASSWLMTRSKRVYIDGEPCIVSIGFDISERKRIEQDLTKYRNKLSMALQASHSGTWEWNPFTGMVDWSEEVWHLYGLEQNRSKPSSELWEQVVHPEDRARVIFELKETAARRGELDIEYRVCHPDGSVRWILSRGKHSPSSNGKQDALFVGTIIDITDHKLLELELHKNKKLFDQALEAARVGVWERGLETNEVVWSDTLWKLFGLTKEQQPLTFDLWSSIVHPEDREKALKAANAATGSGVEMNIEYRICHPDGGIRWVMSRGKPLFSDQGAIDRYIGSIIDITEQKLLQKELLESKLRFGYALDAAHAGIWEWNVLTDELSWSDQVWMLYGLKPGSAPLNHQLCVDTIHVEDRDMVSRIIKQAVLDGNSASVEFRACHPDGSVHWLTSRGMPMFDDNGKLTRYIGAVIDITERKQIELALIESRHRLDQAFEAARAGVWEWDLSTNDNIWSNEIWELYGIIPKEDLVASFMLWASSIHPDDRQKTIREVTEAAKKQSELNVEYRVVHPDGSIRWLMSRGKPLLDDQGKAYRYIGTIIDITERKIAELELNESKLRFNFALEATKAGVWEWDMKTDRVNWSEQIWGLYGLKPHSVTPSHRLCESNVFSEDKEETFAQVMAAASHDTDFTVEFRVRHPDGSLHWLMCHGVPLPGNDENSCSYLGTVMDITERRQADEELRRSQAKLNFVLSRSNLGVWELDIKTSVAQRSLEHARIFGYQDIASPWSLEKFFEHIVPEDRARVEDIVNHAFSCEESYSFECRIMTATGQSRWIWVFGAFNSDFYGKARNLYGIVQDITDRKITELLLKENEQKFRNIFEFSPIAIGIEDPEELILLDVNTSWLKLFDCSREQVIGRQIQDLGIFQSAEDHGQIATVLREQGRIFNRTFELRKTSGDFVIVLLSAELITLNGKTRMLVMMTDITVQELQQANISQLEKVVADRTDQLRQEVERLHRFLSMISHEYRTPLAIIRGNLDLIDLKHKAGNYSNDREMSKIKRAIDRLIEVMEVSIQESRVLESPKSLPAERFPIEPVVASQVEAFHCMWPERQINSSGSLGEAMTFGEAAQLKMAIFNLLDNSRKYSPHGTPITVERRIDDGEAVITIMNEGKPFTSIEGEELFEKYHRGSNAANTAGAGIGLWLVKNIIEQHRGTVSLKGTVEGVVAEVRLPLVSVEEKWSAST